MLFVVDIGNSHTVTGIYDGNNLNGQWRLKTDLQGTSDEIAIRYSTLFNLSKLNPENITRVVISSVVPTLESAWVNFCKEYFGQKLTAPPFLVSNKSVGHLIKILINQPEELGADRIVNSLAAWYQNRCNLIVIDFGTAITFDCVSSNCEYLGGTILPGVFLSLEALSAKTAKLPQIDITNPPKHIIGKNTIEAMKSGIVNGYGAMVDGMVNSIKKEMPLGETKVIATGGISEIISTFSTTIDEVSPMLTLQGLKNIDELI